MPRSTMTNEEQWKLPKGVPLPATLESVEVKTINYVKDGKEKSFDKWQWEFVITEGDYAGLKAWADTEDRLTNHPDNMVRQIAEALLGGVEFEVGTDLDTDELIGLQGYLMVDNTEYTNKKGEVKYLCPVTQVFPIDTQFQDENPPF